MSVLDWIGILSVMMIAIVLATWVGRLSARRSPAICTSLALASIIGILMIYATVYNMERIARRLHQINMPIDHQPTLSLW